MPQDKNRSIRVFVSSTFRDMQEERNALMAHTWPQLKSFCKERHVEFVEVDLRWGIPEEQSTRKETLKLCLDEIKACRPFFIGLLGERYGWVPGDEAFTPDLKEEQPWLHDVKGKSVTELEILHGVLNNPEMAGRSFFYFRDSTYAHSQKNNSAYLPESNEAAEKQDELKARIRKASTEKNIPLHEDYPDPQALSELVLKQLKEAIETSFPKEEVPNPFEREAREHEAYAEIRCRTYIGRSDYYQTLDHHVSGDGVPLVVLGDSGSGKSALLANWVNQWRESHPNDFIFQHYIGGTSASADHWGLMSRLMAEIKRWADDPDELPSSRDKMLRDFPLWLSKARSKAQHEDVRFIVLLDALNQLQDIDHGKHLGWLASQPFNGPLRLIVSTLPGKSREVLEKRKWPTLQVQPLTEEERKKMIAEYLKRFGKELDEHRVDRIAEAETSSNPLYLKILLDELRVTGTHDRLDELLDDYLSTREIPTLLSKVLARYQRDYEHDRKDLVKDTMALIWAARRGLTENELRELLRPEELPQLQLATWAPLRAALADNLVDMGGVLNFAHDFLRQAVENAFLPNLDAKDECRLILADYFEEQPIAARNCDELPWLLQRVKLDGRLRQCLLNMDRFLEIYERSQDELQGYWVYLKEESRMGKAYIDAFYSWTEKKGVGDGKSSSGASQLGFFLHDASFYSEAELLQRKALQIYQNSLGKDHPQVVTSLNELARLLQVTNRYSEAESMYRKALQIRKHKLGNDHLDVAASMNNFASLLKATGRYTEAESLCRKALQIHEKILGRQHPIVATVLNNLASLLKTKNCYPEAEQLYRRALQIDEDNLGSEHPSVATTLNNLAELLKNTNHLEEVFSLHRRALQIREDSLGKHHPEVANSLNNIACLLQGTNRYDEAEPLYRRAIQIREDSLGKEHLSVAMSLNNLATLLRDTNRVSEAEPFSRKAVGILLNFTLTTGRQHPNLQSFMKNYDSILHTLGWSKEQIVAVLKKMAPELVPE